MIILKSVSEHKIEREDIVYSSMFIVDRNIAEGKQIFMYIITII